MQVLFKFLFFTSIIALLVLPHGAGRFIPNSYITSTKNLKISSSDRCQEIKNEIKERQLNARNLLSRNYKSNTWYADIPYGFIGTTDLKPVDNPFDNIFHVQLPFLPSKGAAATLNYELYGVSNHESIARSINESQAIGGHFVSLNNAWSIQKESIPLALLHPGDNVIRFSLPANATYHYEVRKVGIHVEDLNEDKPAIVLNQSDSAYYDQYAYIKGIISLPSKYLPATFDKALLKCGDQTIPIQDGEFESIIPNPENKPFHAVLETTLPDGYVVTKDILFGNKITADLSYFLEEKGLKNESVYIPANQFELHLSGIKTSASISIPAHGLSRSKSISITALREVDLPILNPDMVNVTAGSKGYRFLPHGTVFEKSATLSIPYDNTLIPPGYTAEDIRSYYFDEAAREWKSLQLDSIDLLDQTVLSQTMHFTDMINGIIKVPESPETQGYTPTSIKDFKPADPSAGITMIAPPTANSRGNAAISFDLKLPSGRQGMEPDLSLQYNNGGGNGWLGLGWDLSIPYISIDTRWGVPRYDSLLETETYIMEGEQLAPIAHRGPLVKRNNANEKEFYPRVEKSFDKIIRHGSSPSKYWWEVTNKHGIRSFYGGLPEKGVIDSAVLKDNNGNLSYWALVQTRDLDDNCAHYLYTTVEDPGIIGPTDNLGRQLYIDTIFYTGNHLQDGPYNVVFTRDRQLPNFKKRKDVMIDCRLGYKMVTADLLKKITINLNDLLIRSYELKYKEGAFYKTLLDSISELDDKGELFYAHAFEYYDDVNAKAGYEPLGEVKKWKLDKDEINGGIINPIPGFSDQTSALSTEKSNSFGLGLALTVGFIGDGWSKQFTVGGSFEFDYTGNEGLVCMVDINGDGLPDKVIKRDDSLFYRANIKGSDAFAARRPIKGLNTFSSSTALTFSGGLQIVPPLGFFGYNHASTTSTTSTFFSDFNGDGLIDIASNGQVFFNHIDAQGDPVFEKFSRLTPNPLNPGGTVDKAFLAPDTALQHREEKEYPLQDIIRFWTAPFDGTIQINAPIQLVQVPDSLRSKKEDGVRATIQWKDKIVWNTVIPAGDFNIRNTNTLNALDVKTGDRLYFRLQSIYNGENDVIYWDPVISYISPVFPESDVNKKNSSHYKASEDFIISASQPLGIPKSGAVKITGDFFKSITSDTVVLKVIRKDSLDHLSILFQKIYPGRAVANGPLEEIVLKVTQKDVLSFEVHADTYIDRTAVQWFPRYELTFLDSMFLDSMIKKPVIQKGTIIPTNNDYNTWLTPTPVFFNAVTDTFRIFPKVSFKADSSGTIIFSIKSPDTIYAKQMFSVQHGKVVGIIDTLSLLLPAGVPLYAEYHVSDESLAQTLQSISFGHIKDTVITDSAGKNPRHITLQKTIPAGLYTNSNEKQLNPLFRGWGQFSFAGDKGDGPLIESKLNFDETTNIDYKSILADTAKYRKDPSSMKSVPSPAKSDFVSLYGNAQKRRWVGRDSSVFVSKDTMSSSRLWKHNVLADSLMIGAGESLTAVNKVEQSEVNSLSGGFIISGSFSDATTVTQLDMMDMNGDEYPDVIHTNDVQFTQANGGLEPKRRENALQPTNSHGISYGISLGGKFPKASASNKRNGGAANAHNNKTNSNARSEHNTANASIGLSGNLGYNDQSAGTSWIDMNGDGLPDKVYNNGDVALNLGYSFAAPENWSFKEIDESNTTSLGAGIGVNLFAGTIEAGVGISRSEDHTKSVLLDINGDGLPDKILATNPLTIQLNTGNGFQDSTITWKGATVINKTLSTGESINAAFTVAIDIIFIKICINPSINIGHGVSGQMDQIVDIDGDGYPDLLHSDNEGDLSVRSSLIGRTNMLSKVQRPMGSGFSIKYDQLGSTYNMSSHNVWAMTGLEIYDGVQGDGVDTMRNRFTYVGGHFDRREREFYGFDTVRTYQLNTASNNTVYRSTEEIFLNNNYYIKGSLKSETILDAASNPYTKTINDYSLKPLHDSVAFPAMIQSRHLIYEGQTVAGASTYTQYEYDDLGNIIKISDIGDGSQQDLLIANIKYHSNDSLYLKDIPSEIQVNTVEGVKRKRTTTIDRKGHITQVNQYLTNDTATNTDLEYDSYGNLSKILRPANYKGERMYYQYAYDDLIHSRIISTSDAYGYSDSTTYEYRFGNPLSTTSMQNEQVHFNIDNRGRIRSVTGPYELAAGKPYTLAFEYHPEANVPYAVTHHYDPEDSSDIDIITFMDGLGRAVQVKKLGSLFKGKNLEDELKMIVSGNNTYDAFGRITKKYYPTTEPLGPSNTSFKATLGNIDEIIGYDVVDRAQKHLLADGASDSLTYSAIDNLMITQMIDAMGNKAEKYDDVRGRQKIIKQYGGPNGTITTTYFYNALNELLYVEDNNKNKIENKYDNLGRRLSILHPDAGLTEYSYDLAGNLLQKITPQIRKQVPKGGAIQYAYDHERIISIDYPIQYQNKVSYSYGGPGTGNRTGRLTLLKDASGGHEFYYGKLGEVTKEIRTVLANTVFYTTYVSEQEYDTWNRIKKMTYPDGEVVSYHYNRGGDLNSIEGKKTGTDYAYVSKVGYNEFGEKVYLKYGNGTEMNYGFDNQRRRLLLLQATAASGSQMMNNSYTYDPVSNITGIFNNTSALQGKLGGRASQKYTYDNLYRLISATGQYDGFKDTASYGLAMAYDNLYNITNKQLFKKDTSGNYKQSYLYTGTAPHQPNQIGNNKCNFDLNGNLTLFGNAEYFWDEENRLMGALDHGILSEYTYDAAGERVIKSSGGIQGTWLNGSPAGTINHHDNYTVYVSPYLVCRKNSFTKHIYMGSERIVSKIGEGHFTNISFPLSALTAGGINYIQRASQLKQDRVSYYAGLGVSPGPPTNKLFYADPQNSGIAPPVLVDSTSANTPPPGWPGNTTKPTNGPPIYVAPIPGNNEVKAGYGFESTGHILESNQYFFHSDHLGSTSYLTNVVGEAVQHLEYVAFGETFFEEKTSNVTNLYLYSTKEHDDETGLYYYGARYYSPSTSQWISVDPKAIGFPNMTPYGFVANNPIIYIDPDGMKILISFHEYDGFGGYSQKLVEYRKGKLFNTDQTQYLENNEVALKVSSQLNELRGSSRRLKRRMRTLEQSNFEHRIEIQANYKGNNRMFVEAGTVTANPPRPGSSLFYYHPDENLPDEDKNVIHAKIILAHELLGHSFDADQNSYDLGSSNGINNYEVNAVVVENIARKKFGFKKRIMYGPNKIGKERLNASKRKQKLE